MKALVKLELNFFLIIFATRELFLHIDTSYINNETTRPKGF